jgi:hypothetical protein
MNLEKRLIKNLLLTKNVFNQGQGRMHVALPVLHLVMSFYLNALIKESATELHHYCASFWSLLEMSRLQTFFLALLILFLLFY